MADQLLTDIANAVDELDKLQYPTSTRIAAEKKEKVKSNVFTHTGKKK
jgi:glutamate decarboxylase